MRCKEAEADILEVPRCPEENKRRPGEIANGSRGARQNSNHYDAWGCSGVPASRRDSPRIAQRFNVGGANSVLPKIVETLGYYRMSLRDKAASVSAQIQSSRKRTSVLPLSPHNGYFCPTPSEQLRPSRFLSSA